VTNTSLDLEAATGNRTIDSAWAAQVRRHTLARLPRTLPKPP
jgi:hypothetical protein